MNELKEGYKYIETEDGSLTLYSPLFDENCHSTSGAISETIHTYIDANQVVQRASEKKQINILEVGLGTGIGFLTTIEAVKSITHLKMNYLVLEIDQELISLFLNSANLPYQLLEDNLILVEKSEGIKLFILKGDARIQLLRFIQKNPHMKFDVIYQDAFSPKKNPTLWTKQWFQTLASCSHSETSMSTYSSTKKMQKAMLESGFGVRQFKGHPPKKWSTLAYYQQDSQPELLAQLSAIEPFVD